MVIVKETSILTENDLCYMEGRPSEKNGSESFNQFDKTHLEEDEFNYYGREHLNCLCPMCS